MKHYYYTCATPIRGFLFFELYAKGNTANARGKTEDLNQSNATDNAIGNAEGNLTSCHMLWCSALT